MPGNEGAFRKAVKSGSSNCGRRIAPKRADVNQVGKRIWPIRLRAPNWRQPHHFWHDLQKNVERPAWVILSIVSSQPGVRQASPSRS